MVLLYYDTDVGKYAVRTMIIIYNILLSITTSEPKICVHNVRCQSDTGTYPKNQFGNNKKNGFRLYILSVDM